MKPDVYTQIYLHFVFSPMHRECLIRNEFKDELYKYIGRTIDNFKHKPIIINGMPDHIHILIGLNPKQSISDLVRDIKRSSARFMNDKKWLKGKFQWQPGYGAFSYGRFQLDHIYNSIKNQEFHHKKQTFKLEYTEFLKRYEVGYDEKYLFQFFDD